LGDPFLGWLQFISSVYFVTIIIVSVLIAFKKGKFEYFLTLPVIFVVRHIALGFGFVREWLDTVRVREPQAAPPSSPAPPATSAPPTSPSPSS